MSTEQSDLYDRVKEATADGVQEGLKSSDGWLHQHLSKVGERISAAQTKTSQKIEEQTNTLRGLFKSQSESQSRQSREQAKAINDLAQVVKAASTNKELGRVAESLKKIGQQGEANSKALSGMSKSSDALDRSTAKLSRSVDELKDLTGVAQKQLSQDLKEYTKALQRNNSKLATSDQVANLAEQSRSESSLSISSIAKSALAAISAAAAAIGIYKYAPKVAEAVKNPGSLLINSDIPVVRWAARKRAEGSINSDLDDFDSAKTDQERSDWYSRRGEDVKENISILRTWVEAEKLKPDKDQELIDKISNLIEVTKEKLDSVKKELVEQPKTIAENIAQTVVDAAAKFDIFTNTAAKTFLRAAGMPEGSWLEKILDNSGLTYSAQYLTGAAPSAHLQSALIQSRVGNLGSFKKKASSYMSRFMDEFGLTKEQAAGVFGNLGHESTGLTPGILQKDGGGGLGWAQWTGPRRADFEKYLQRTGQSAGSDEANYGFLVHEIKNKYKRAIARLKSAANEQDALRLWHDEYEVSADIDRRTGRIVKPRHWASRQAYTKAALESVSGRTQLASTVEEEEEEEEEEVGQASSAEAAEIAFYEKSLSGPGNGPLGRTLKRAASRVRSWLSKTVEAVSENVKESIDWNRKNNGVVKAVDKAIDKVTDKVEKVWDEKTNHWEPGWLGDKLIRFGKKVKNAVTGKGFVVDAKRDKQDQISEPEVADTQADDGSKVDPVSDIQDWVSKIKIPDQAEFRKVQGQNLSDIMRSMDSEVPGKVLNSYRLMSDGPRPNVREGTIDNVKGHWRDVVEIAEAVARGNWVSNAKQPVDPNPVDSSKSTEMAQYGRGSSGTEPTAANIVSLSQIPMTPFDLELANQNTGKTI